MLKISLPAMKIVFAGLSIQLKQSWTEFLADEYNKEKQQSNRHKWIPEHQVHCDWQHRFYTEILCHLAFIRCFRIFTTLTAVHTETEIRAILEDTRWNQRVTFNMIQASFKFPSTRLAVERESAHGFCCEEILRPAVWAPAHRQLCDVRWQDNRFLEVPQARFETTALMTSRHGAQESHHSKLCVLAECGAICQCRAYTDATKSPRKTTLKSGLIPNEPWNRVTNDYVVPIDGLYYLVNENAFSQWLEIFWACSITDYAINNRISTRNVCTLVSDNVAQFLWVLPELLLHQRDFAQLHITGNPIG